MSLKTIYIYTDTFQPPHLGKKVIWDLLTKRYGIDNCFIAADNTTGPLSFDEKQSIFASMGIDSGNVIKSQRLFSQIKLPSKFNPQEAVVVWITTKENVRLIPKNIRPYTKTPVPGQSYYMTIPQLPAKLATPNLTVELSGSSITDNQVIDFLGKIPMSKDTNMVAFKKIFGFFDEYLYKVLTEKFKNKILKESPDQPKTTSLTWQSSDAVVFILFKDFRVWARKRTHSQLTNVFQLFRDDCLMGEVDMDSKKYEIHGMSIEGDLKEALKQINQYNKDRYNYQRNGRYLGRLTGRLWDEHNLVSIWKESFDELTPGDFKLLTSMVSRFGNPRDYVYDDAIEETDDSDVYEKNKDKKPYTFDETNTLITVRTTSNPTNIGDRFKNVKHVMDPIMKHALKTFDKDTPYNKKAELADKLGINVAKLNALLSVDESSINESPDRPKTNKIISFQDSEAVTFIIFDRFIMTGAYTDWHSNLATALENFGREADSGKIDLSKNEYTDPDGTIKIEGDIEHASHVAKEFANNRIRSRDLGLVTGRIWPDSKVVSIWKYSYKDINKRTFKKLEDFVSLYGDPKQFLYDDASASSEGPATTYDKVSSIVSGEEEPKPSNNIGDKFKDVKHVMDPVLKNILKTFDKDTPYNKRAEIADKLGMTVAQLNSLLNIEENH